MSIYKWCGVVKSNEIPILNRTEIRQFPGVDRIDLAQQLQFVFSTNF